MYEIFRTTSPDCLSVITTLSAFVTVSYANDRETLLAVTGYASGGSLESDVASTVCLGAGVVRT